MQQLSLSSINAKHIEEISSSRDEPSWLKLYREKSLAVYEQLPPEVSPLYNKYTDAKRMDPSQVAINLVSDKTVSDFIQKRIDELKSESYIIQIGSNIHSVNLAEDVRSSGLTICSIDDALKNNSSLVQSVLESTDPSDDKYTALNNAAFNSGIFIHVPKNLVLEKPIHIISALSLDGISTISRNVIVADDNSKVKILQELYSPDAKQQQAYLELLNTSAGANSQLEVTTLQMMNENAINFSTRRTDVAQDAKVNWYLGLFGGMLSRYKINYYLNGNGASVNDSEIIFGDSEQSFDLSVNMNHEKPSTEGKVIEKSVLKDKSKSLFKGMIRIKENASQSKSFLSGRSILLDKGAKSDSIPGLEIFTNDVKATHSASVAQIDEEQIFYLGTRCLDRAQAERIIVEGFLEPLSRNLSSQVRAWIAYLIESKWLGQKLQINTDEQLKALVEVEEVRYREADQLETHYKYR